MAPLQIGQYSVWPPVVLAPMAGITNGSFRKLCREFGAGLYVCEMVTTRALVERDPKTMDMVRFGPEEKPRSLQLYGVDPVVVGRAVSMVVDDNLADHIDLNFGCPVPKVTRRGGGSALPYKRKLFESIVSTAVRIASTANIPVTIKMRIGIDPEHITYLNAGRIAADSGVAAVALHGRTAIQHYSGSADWSAISRLKEAVTTVPVLGNGDIFAAGDALAMMEQTGCDGVVVGRGCQGRPWLFAELAAAFDGRTLPTPPDLRAVAGILQRHAQLLGEEMGADRGMRDMRKHFAWYLKGFAVGGEIRAALGTVSSMPELQDLLSRMDLDQPYPQAAEGPRGRQGTAQRRVHLPEGWLDDPEEDVVVAKDAELDISGG
ncbi:tRNA dihydrouridine synthase DusB [Nakamurella antarctica]|uniref:tRNA-dihydrouridine synthase n=1 Tax=Nakamurella antarctica TaxID=1902245 RepID=A0A3G9A053_9ACTN|nr:tRNA dihydrouridine synthase DusB [Nakamurella antarctica]